MHAKHSLKAHQRYNHRQNGQQNGASTLSPAQQQLQSKEGHPMSAHGQPEKRPFQSGKDGNGDRSAPKTLDINRKQEPIGQQTYQKAPQQHTICAVFHKTTSLSQGLRHIGGFFQRILV